MAAVILTYNSNLVYNLARSQGLIPFKKSIEVNAFECCLRCCWPVFPGKIIRKRLVGFDVKREARNWISGWDKISPCASAALGKVPVDLMRAGVLVAVTSQFVRLEHASGIFIPASGPGKERIQYLNRKSAAACLRF